MMHWVQRRRREALRRRISNGEVDLEALGIKRLTVPQDIIDKMPMYTYTCAKDDIRRSSDETTRKCLSYLNQSLSVPIF